MRKFFVSVITAFALCSQSQAADAIADTSSYQVGTSFVDALIDSHEFEQLSITELAKIPKRPAHDRLMFATIIRNGTRAKLKLNATVARLQLVNPGDKDFAELPTYLANLYIRKVELIDEWIQTAKAMIAGPRTGVDYGKITGHMPEVTAQFDVTNETIFKSTPMVGLMLVARKPDSRGELSHFVITRKEAQRLITRLQDSFGKELEKKDQNWTISAATVMHGYLRDPARKFADDPWH